MKAVLLLLLSAAALQAGEIEGTKWYNHEGKLVMVDGPAAATKKPDRWRPQWAIDDERRAEALRGKFRHRRSRYGGYDDYGYGYGYGGWGYFYSGAAFGVRVGGYCTPRIPCTSSGLRVIIR